MSHRSSGALNGTRTSALCHCAIIGTHHFTHGISIQHRQARYLCDNKVSSYAVYVYHENSNSISDDGLTVTKKDDKEKQSVMHYF